MKRFCLSFRKSLLSFNTKLEFFSKNHAFACIFPAKTKKHRRIQSSVPLLYQVLFPDYSALGASSTSAAGASVAGASAAGAASAFFARLRRVVFLASFLEASEAIAASLKSTNSIRAISEPSPCLKPTWRTRRYPPGRSAILGAIVRKSSATAVLSLR